MQTIDADNWRTTLIYDNANRKIGMSNVKSQPTSYSYLANGLLEME